MSNGTIKGHGTIKVIDKNGKVKQEVEFGNLVTQFGDQFYGERGAGVAGAPGDITGMKLGTGDTNPSKTGAGAALVTYLADSHQALDAGFPASSLSGESRRITWEATYAVGKATADGISEVVLVNDALADATSPEGNTIARSLLSPVVNKGADDALVITWHHDIIGA